MSILPFLSDYSWLKIDQVLPITGMPYGCKSISGEYLHCYCHWRNQNEAILSSSRLAMLLILNDACPPPGRFDGHIVPKSHVDTTAVCREVKDLKGSWEFVLSITKTKKKRYRWKGSITVNGVKSHCGSVRARIISVCIIPYTLEHTNFKNIAVGSVVNLEFDVIGKYVARILATRN